MTLRADHASAAIVREAETQTMSAKQVAANLVMFDAPFFPP